MASETWPVLPDDGEAVSDAEDPDQALARAVIGVDDEQAEPAGDR